MSFPVTLRIVGCINAGNAAIISPKSNAPPIISGVPVRPAMDKVMAICMLIDSVQAAHDRIYKQSIAIKALAVMSILNSIAIVVTCFAVLLN